MMKENETLGDVFGSDPFAASVNKKRKIVITDDDINELYSQAIKGDLEALEELKEEAKKGHVEARFNVGIVYLCEHGDFEQAFKWLYLSASEQNHPLAQYNIGVMYEKGGWLQTNTNKALEWYKKAAKQKHPLARYNIGKIYEHGKGVDINADRAFKYYRKAAEQQHPMSQYIVATMYETGTGVQKNNAKALKWYKKALEKNYSLRETTVSYDTGQVDNEKLGAFPSFPRDVCHNIGSAEQAVKRLEKELGLGYQ